MAKPKPKSKPEMREIRILMLHGYTQSGPLFRTKTRALEKILAKSLLPFNLYPNLLYPTGPNRLHPKDIPGYEPSAPNSVSEDEEIDSWAWFRKDEATGTYRFLREGMETIAECMKAEGEGKVDGVMGFSQGGCMAGMVASAMEVIGPEGQKRTPPENDDQDWGWVKTLREANGGKPLEFAVVYSGFYAPLESLKFLYENPPLQTPTLQYAGSLDTVVDENRSHGLVERCKGPVEITHPGGHFVPVSKEWVVPLAGFLKNIFEDKDAGDVKDDGISKASL